MEEKIIEAAKQYGFNLEFRASQILIENHYKVATNTIKTLNEISCETDILAWDISGIAIAAECKGTQKNSLLLAIREPNNSLNDFSIENKKILNSEYTLGQFKPYQDNYFFTFSGDFFKYNIKNDLSKITKNDDENNFYKAINQIQTSIIMASKIDFPMIQGNKVKTIIPMIITNADIYVIDYSLESEPTVSLNKWILHKAIVSRELSLPLGTTALCFPVVNIQFLSEFLKKCMIFDAYYDCYCIDDGKLSKN
ncbi:TPA: hypothetical protein JBH59_13430 [Legionella pneumophila]|uniref:hypothetical protein n=1 Tax=Legionella pneumophila TaxID=446 RepID=UPI0007707C0E|nr:hypothetical protein [Legionella pneumophila]HAT9118305.1 hypothetical protein [Legionella pneumophila subsp. pneumophila]CZJ16564.1 Uncharacterised protein [Legionella pneumophila]CZJ26013.1 Uncharacterised protein [Legionella pneumophila]CZJ26625.1 Uncharacterised protein [Legionella pneumophila]CZJ29635.1 Uncharacterised protein [Legionella pneumophila]